MANTLKKVVGPLLDIALLPAALLMAPVANVMARLGGDAPRSRALFDRAGVGLVRHHYYQPLVFPSDLRLDLSAPRTISGFDLNETGQLALIDRFRYRDELLAIPLEKQAPLEFFYHNGGYEAGDAEYLYNIIRLFKPRRIVEIGCGSSTLMARRAILQNKSEDAAYACDHVCIEPFEQPWLEQLGVTVMREMVETCPVAMFDALGENDILFIDSSHVIRPQGDVLHEYLFLLGRLAPGVLVHVHDIFTPFDYPDAWVRQERRMWNEQYLLEAFLCFNSAFEPIGAVNWLSHVHRDRLGDACPVLVREPWCEPGAFWLRRVR
jgi:predicted O-methyltransferase YrrM